MVRNSDETKRIDKFIGNKLTDIIYRHSISRRELANAINVSVQQLNKYESGMNRIPASRLLLIAKALNKRTAFFYEMLTHYLESVENSVDIGEEINAKQTKSDKVKATNRELEFA